jgi:NAD(P)-dependent dehydrogenase (short-subunit alcohol dehydrogenase family)
LTMYKNLLSLDDKVAIVTGGSGILGSEFCKALCGMGATVLCLDTQKELLSKLVTDLEGQYGQHKIEGYVCDISNQNDVRQVTSEIVAKHGKIDILLNNAATKTKNLSDFFSTFTDYSLSAWREVMSVNLDGMFLMAQAVGKQMILKRQGVIVQTASIYSLLAPDQRIYKGSEYLGSEINTPAVYTASKAGVIGLTKHLAALWAEYGVRVNALCPGGVSSGQNDEFNKKYSARIPMGRMAEKEDMIGPMLFLVSGASNYVTGQTLFVDGGLSVW